MRTRFCAVALCVCGTAVAQNLQVTHTNPLSIQANATIFRTSKGASTPANTNLVPSHTLWLTYFGVSAGFYTGTTVTTAKALVRTASVANAFGPATSAGVSADSVVTFKAAQPFDAVLRVTVESFASSSRQLWFATIDIGGSAPKKLTATLGQAIVHEMRVRIDSRGLPVRLHTGASAIAFPDRDSCLGRVDVELEPITRAESYGKTCTTGTPKLEARPLLGGFLDLTLTSKSPHTLGARLIGTRPLSVAIPGTGCWLNTDIAVTLPLMTDASGTHTTRWPIPLNLQFQAQDVLATASTSGPTITTTNGLRITRR